MALILKPSIFVQQPIGFVKARGQGLVHAWGVWTGGPSPTGADSPSGLYPAVLDLVGTAHTQFGSGTGTNPSGNRWAVSNLGKTAGIARAILYDNTGTGSAASVVHLAGNSAGTGAASSTQVPITVSAWIRISASSALQAIYGISANGGLLLRLTTTPRLEWVKPGTAVIGTASAGTLSLNTWYHIAASLDGIGNFVFYVDGVNVGSGTSDRSPFTLGQVTLGSESGGARPLLNGGMLANVKVWNRVLSQPEIVNDYVNPYFVFEPHPARRFHLFTAGGAVNTTDVDSAEFDHEISSVDLTQAHQITTVSAEFDREFQSVSLAYSVQPASAEFDREHQSAALTGNIVAQSAEFDREFQSVSVATGIVINSAEFEREFGSVGISKVVAPQSEEFDREFGSVSIATTEVDVKTAEFDREFGSAAITKIIAPGSSEYDSEWGSVGFPQAGTADVDAPEFDWETGSPGLRQFMAPANTPKSRIKRVRLCC